jgi:neutral ceramidase
VVYDGVVGKNFGDVITDVNKSYAVGQTASAKFAGANPRNNLRLEGTFAAVEKQNGSSWTRVRDDSDWNLVYRWKRTVNISGESEVTISWTIENGTPGRLLSVASDHVC